ncbi:hypothetical protein OG339_48910 (plasmid) [Streptosporangium sp. NBC_01495]|uniref:hypothetical protein n=1 Tax=Streptosporangium sp. NBC_01495 TaxID=2903899 RepID=UPI002E2F5590|nr:hypothetical protein [Streptosporangium sp. NBC_01495]
MSSFAGHSLPQAARLRRQLTGESFQSARAEIADSGLLLAAPTPGQEIFEARVMAALLEEFGRHDPKAVGGPYGIARLSPRPAEISMHVDRAQLPRWAAALAPIQHANGSVTGLATLRWSQEDKAIVLHAPPTGARIVLTRTFAKDWRTALAHAAAGGQVLAGDGDAPISAAERHHAEQEEVRLRGCAAMLAGLLRRIILVDRLAELPSHGSAVELRLRADATGTLRLTDLSTRRARLSAPWVQLHVPAEVWPTAGARQQRRLSAGAAVRALLAEAPPLPEPAEGADRRQSDAFANAALQESGDALALCMVAGMAIQPITVAAATWALTVADRQLADPRAGYLFDEPGGWVANRRRYAEDWINESGPVDPPGARPLLKEHDLDLSALGRVRFTLPDGVPVWVHHAQPAIRFGTGPSLSAALVMAEHAAMEVAAGADKLRTAERRLLIPRPVAADADPTVTQLIAQAAPGGQVLDLFDLVASLRSFADDVLRSAGRSEPPMTYTGAAEGHTIGSDDNPELCSITAFIGQNAVLPGTRPGEAANTASVDSLAYRRHLAAHGCALDPFAARYLVAADAVAGPLPFSARHAAGVAALREADLAVLQALDPRPPSPDLERVIAELPTEIGQITDFFQRWYERRSPSSE